MEPAPLHGSLEARDLERVWIVRVMTALSGLSMTLGYIWMQNTYEDQRSLRVEFAQLQTTLATVATRQGDVREINATQEAELRALRASIHEVRIEMSRMMLDHKKLIPAPK